jgi:hypothetical protein
MPLHHVWGADSLSVVAVDESGLVQHNDNGSLWSPLCGSPPGVPPLYGVWGSAASDLYAVGDPLPDGSQYILHFGAAGRSGDDDDDNDDNDDDDTMSLPIGACCLPNNFGCWDRASALDCLTWNRGDPLVPNGVFVADNVCQYTDCRMLQEVACCTGCPDTATCSVTSAANCYEIGLAGGGPNSARTTPDDTCHSDCDDDTIANPQVACCMDGFCNPNTTELQCATNGGKFSSDGTCNTCPPPPKKAMVIVYMAKIDEADELCTGLTALKNVDPGNNTLIVILADTYNHEQEWQGALNCAGWGGSLDVGYYFVGQGEMASIPDSGSWTDGINGQDNSLSKALQHVIGWRPADYYFLVLSGHGNAWFGNSWTGSALRRFDSSLSLASQLQSGLNGIGVTTIGFDACYEQNIEVAYDLSAKVVNGQSTTMVGSEMTTYNPWPYGMVLPPIIAYPPISAHQLGISIVGSVYDAGWWDPQTTQSLELSPTGMQKLGAAIEKLGQAIYDGGKDDRNAFDGAAQWLARVASAAYLLTTPHTDKIDANLIDLYSVTCAVADPDGGYNVHQSVRDAAQAVSVLLTPQGQVVDEFKESNNPLISFNMNMGRFGGASIFWVASTATIDFGNAFSQQTFAVQHPCWAVVASNNDYYVVGNLESACRAEPR